MWKSHPVFPDYEASQEGVVRNKATERELAGHCTPRGYRRINIRKKHHYRHRFVYQCWHGHVEDGMQIDHVDGDKNNNSLSNLRAVDAASHALKTARQNPAAPQKSRDTRARPVVVTHPSGDKTFCKSVADAMSKVPGSCRPLVSKCLLGIRPKHKGCTWQFIQQEDNNDLEQWKPILGLTVSSMGRIRLKLGRVVYGSAEEGGYRRVKIGGRSFLVHRLICQAFHGEPSAGCTVDHIDRNIHNNAASNLRWADCQQQATNCKSVRQVQGVNENGTIVGKWATCREASKATGVDNSTISKIARGKIDRVCNGMRFQFVV